MTGATERLIVLLGRHADLEWFKYTAEDQLADILPRVVWRFKLPAPGLEELIGDAIRDYVSQVQWLHEKQGRNWVLMPARLQAFQTSRSIATDAAAMRVLCNEDPSFCREAWEDFARLVNLLAVKFEHRRSVGDERL